MKRINKILLIVLLIVSTKTYLNPIMESFLREVKFEQGGWTIELFGISENTNNEIYLGSNSGIAYFKDDLVFDGGYKLITQDSLQSILSIDPAGDQISLYLWGTPFNSISFGNVSGSQIAAPLYDYSMSQYRVNVNEDRFYLDMTPTLGTDNDTIDACGYIGGQVVDDMGTPVDSVIVEYDYREIYDQWGMYLKTDTLFVYTDMNGYFQIHDVARQVNLVLKKMNYVPYQSTRQIYPWMATDAGEIELRSDVNKVDDNEIPTDYLLLRNYPNPFNPSTTIMYTVPGKEDMQRVSVDILNPLGKQIDRLVNLSQHPGTYKINFNAGNLSSGIYLCRLNAGVYSKTIKILLLK